MTPRRDVFISYHHESDQHYKETLLEWNRINKIFNDMSVDTGDIDPELSDQVIREKIRDEYLRDSTVTILLVGTETKRSKHIDWEIYSSMYDGSVNKKSGVLVVNLPTINCEYFQAEHGMVEKNTLYPDETSWTTIETRAEFERRFPYMPERILDNLVHQGAKISVANWRSVTLSPERLKLLIDLTFSDRDSCQYDLSRPMRRARS